MTCSDEQKALCRDDFTTLACAKCKLPAQVDDLKAVIAKQEGAARAVAILITAYLYVLERDNPALARYIEECLRERGVDRDD